MIESNELADHKLVPICLLYVFRKITRFYCMFIIKVILFHLFYGFCLLVSECYSNDKHKENRLILSGPWKKSLSVKFYLHVLVDFFFFDINKFSCYSPSELGKWASVHTYIFYLKIRSPVYQENIPFNYIQATRYKK